MYGPAGGPPITLRHNVPNTEGKHSVSATPLIALRHYFEITASVVRLARLS